LVVNFPISAAFISLFNSKRKYKLPIYFKPKVARHPHRPQRLLRVAPLSLLSPGPHRLTSPSQEATLPDQPPPPQQHLHRPQHHPPHPPHPQRLPPLLRQEEDPPDRPSHLDQPIHPEAAHQNQRQGRQERGLRSLQAHPGLHVRPKTNLQLPSQPKRHLRHRQQLLHQALQPQRQRAQQPGADKALPPEPRLSGGNDQGLDLPAAQGRTLHAARQADNRQPCRSVTLTRLGAYHNVSQFFPALTQDVPLPHRVHLSVFDWRREFTRS